MMNDEKSKKAKAITMLFGSFGQSNDAERMAIYVEMLNDIPADVLDKVCKKAILECKFLPSVAELVQSARNFIGDMTGNSTPTWEEAWKEIEHEMLLNWTLYAWSILTEIDLHYLVTVCF